MPNLKDFIGDNGELQEGWTGCLNLPPEIANAELIKTRTKDLAGLVTAAVANLSEVGRRVRVPTDAKEFVEFSRKHLGAGEKAEDYEFERPTNLPKGVTYDESIEKAWAARAVELGIPKSIAKEAHKFFNAATLERGMAAAKTLQERDDAGKKALEAKYGKDLPKVLAKAAQVFMAFSSEDHRKAVGATSPEVVVEQLGGDLAMTEFLYAIGEHLKDDKFIQGKAGGAVPDNWKPRYPNWPDIYRDAAQYPREHKWFVDKGFDFITMSWTSKPT